MPTVRSYIIPKYDTDQILRYARTVKNDKNTICVVQDCIAELADKCKMQVCYEICDVTSHGEVFSISDINIDSKALQEHLTGCNKAVIFVATAGLYIDRMIQKYVDISPLKAYIFQAIGAERIEALCDIFEAEMKNIYMDITSRFSPGYGDLSLQIQRDIFDLIDIPKAIGVTLNESMLMSPSKSVSAIIGIRGEK